MGTVAIVGLGLIGGSIGLALKRAEPVDTEVIGFDRDYEVAQRALKAHAVQRLAPTLENAVRDATLVIVATPILNMRKVFEEIAPHLRRGVVVTDTASTKAEVLRWARELLPAGVHFVGGHPMAGKETSGPQAAEASLFDGRPYCIVPSLDAIPGAVNAILDLAKALGAVPLFLDADEHDSYAAAISHVPLAASIALFTLARGTAAWPELASLAGPGFRDLTRLASGAPEISHDIFLTNRTNVLHWLERYMQELQKLADLIGGEDGEKLFRSLAETQLERENFLVSPPQRQEPGENKIELPSATESFMDSMTGRMWRERAQEMMKGLEEGAKARTRAERLRRRE